MAHKKVRIEDGNRFAYVVLTNNPERLLYELAAAIHLKIAKRRIRLHDNLIDSFHSDREAEQAAAQVNITANLIMRKPNNFLLVLDQADEMMQQIFY